MIKAIASFLVTLSLLISPIEVMAATSLSGVGKRPPPTASGAFPTNCVKSPGSLPYGGRSAVRLTNFCPDRVYINVCVRYDDGTAKLYSSGSRVQTGGYMEIYTEPFKRPVDLRIAYNPFSAPVPPPCNTVPS